MFPFEIQQIIATIFIFASRLETFSYYAVIALVSVFLVLFLVC